MTTSSSPLVEGVKHLVTCTCTLPQFESLDPPVFHKFIVFSLINADGSIQPSIARCNNCEGLHRVTEVGLSQKLKKETSAVLPDVEEIKTGLPEKLVQLVERYKLDLPSWQEIQFVFENEKWDRPIILTKEQGDNPDDVSGKYLLISSKSLWRIQTFSTENL